MIMETDWDVNVPRKAYVDEGLAIGIDHRIAWKAYRLLVLPPQNRRIPYPFPDVVYPTTRSSRHTIRTRRTVAEE